MELEINFSSRRLGVYFISNEPIYQNNEKNISIIFNGVLYNNQDLRKYLEQKHYAFKTNSDAEVLAYLYEEYGHSLSEHLEGAFVFVIVDKVNKLIILSRDRFGKKPLYYYIDKDLFAISSEMKRLLQMTNIKNNVHIDKTSLMQYLCYSYVPSPNTILDNIKKLEMSTTLLFNIDDWRMVDKDQYWDLTKTNMMLSDLSEKEILVKMDHLIKNAIQKRITEDVPVGVLLSGGVDSSLICAILHEYVSDLESFTISYPDKKVDESNYAKMVADQLGITSNYFNIDDQDVLALFKETLEYQDEPMTDAALIPGIHLCKYTKEKISISYSGDAGDELFGGYPKYRAQIFAELVNKVPFSQLIISLILNLLNFYPLNRKPVFKKLFKILRYPLGIRNLLWGSGGFLPEELCKLLNVKHIDLNHVFKAVLNYENQYLQKDVMNRAMYLDFKLQLPDWYAMKPYRQSIATSLDIRSPFLDKDLVEFMFTIPSKYKVKLNATKILMKQLASKYVPKEAIYREKKGFRVPLDNWLRTVLKDFIEELLQSPRCYAYFNKEYIMQLWDNHLECKEDNSFKILSIVNFLYFLNKFEVTF